MTGFSWQMKFHNPMAARRAHGENLITFNRPVHFAGGNYHKTACSKPLLYRFGRGDVGQPLENGLTQFFVLVAQFLQLGQYVPDPIKPGVAVELALAALRFI